MLGAAAQAGSTHQAASHVHVLLSGVTACFVETHDTARPGDSPGQECKPHVHNFTHFVLNFM